MDNIGGYERWNRIFRTETGIHAIRFTTPTGVVHERKTFANRPGRLVYDVHGYEEVVAEKELNLTARYTPSEIGVYGWQAFGADGSVAEEGSFECLPSGHPGYVGVSVRDSRYFETSDGASFCVIGINLCLPPSYSLSAGEEFQTSDRTGTHGLLDYRRWFREFSANGGNFARIWLSSPYFEPETDTAGELELEKFARLDGLVELARMSGVRLKFCFEHFRSVGALKSGWSGKVLKHPDNGASPASMEEWFTSSEWQSLWWNKVHAYVNRYGGDPTVMAWELWNEINACGGVPWPVLCDWTAHTAAKLQALVPQQLVVNSLGSFDRAKWQVAYDDFKMKELGFRQVHRYLDYGSELNVCRDAFRLGPDAVRCAGGPDLPVLLAETGAVNDDHTGPFSWYRADHRGLIFHDCVFPAFFAGAAGIGQMWHWDEYVDKNNLWPMFGPFQELLRDIDLPGEGFEPFELWDDGLHVLGLRGNKHLLILLRTRQDDWRSVYLGDRSPAQIGPTELDLPEIAGAIGVEAYTVWKEEAAPSVSIEQSKLKVGPMKLGCFCKIILR